jgi:hypothetical protein
MTRSRARAADEAAELAAWFEHEGPEPTTARDAAPLRAIVAAAEEQVNARAALDEAVAAARREGFSWGAIGAVLGVSRQAARERFGAATALSDLRTRAPRARPTLEVLVAGAIAAGATWEEVGEAIGLSAQVARRRFGGPLGQGQADRTARRAAMRGPDEA